MSATTNFMLLIYQRDAGAGVGRHIDLWRDARLLAGTVV
jgi:hypothetical protein